MGSSSIDLSLSNIWKSWFKFKKGKKLTQELQRFNYYLEESLFALYHKLNDGSYRHGGYRKFITTDSKRREISVASIKDRVVHRLLHEYLAEIYDKTLIFDVWSCRKNKGLLTAVQRTQKFLNKYKNCFVWRADVKKFFDNINQRRLTEILSIRISDKKAEYLLKEIIDSYSCGVNRERERETVCATPEKGNTYWKFNEPDFCQYLFERIGQICKAPH